jgi:hypothetical protein
MPNTHWPELYADYLKSQQWADKRDRVLRRASYHCEGCAQRPAVDVHHLTYEHVTQEFLFELVALCRECHERIHLQSDPRPTGPTWAPRHTTDRRPLGETATGRAMRHQLSDLASKARAKLMAQPASTDEPLGDEHGEAA